MTGPKETIGAVEDLWGRRLVVGIDHGQVTMSPYYSLSHDQANELGRLFFQARLAAAQYRRETAEADR